MSHYAKTPLLKIRDLDEVCAALDHLGLRYERHAEPVAMYGYQNDVRPERAQVVVRRQHTGLSQSNDIGFLLRPDGAVEAIVSDYDRGAKYDAKWERDFVTECCVQREVAKARRLGHRADRTVDQRGRPKLVITGRFR